MIKLRNALAGGRFSLDKISASLYDDKMDRPAETAEHKKEKLIEELSRQYSLDTISLDEYERLVDYAHKIETEKELTFFEKIVHENSRKAAGRRRNEYTILSSRKTTGLRLEEVKKIISILGDNHIIISGDDLTKAETVIHVFAVLGEIVIHVPAGISVVNRVMPVVGGVFGGGESGNSGGGKKLIIEGEVILGNITVKTVKKGPASQS
ncbi:MAG: hypothetical protein LBI94_01075 [Treponema sp.]|jgi:hypothetical protein|nr:hypothetical protein [Treponema sp.]